MVVLLLRRRIAVFLPRVLPCFDGRSRVLRAGALRRTAFPGRTRHREIHLQLLAAHIVEMPAPETYGQGEESRKVVARHVRIAKCREEICVLETFLDPQRPFRVRDLLHGAKYAERKAVPHYEREQTALAAFQQRMLDGDERDKRGYEPHHDVEVMESVDAEREERDRRAWVGAGLYLGIVAHRAEAMVEKRYEQKRDEAERNPYERILLHVRPHARPRLVRRLAFMLLRETYHRLEQDRRQPRHHADEVFRPCAAEEPRESGQHEKHGEDDNVIVEIAHIQLPFLRRPPRTPCRFVCPLRTEETRRRRRRARRPRPLPRLVH